MSQYFANRYGEIYPRDNRRSYRHSTQLFREHADPGGNYQDLFRFLRPLNFPRFLFYLITGVSFIVIVIIKKDFLFHSAMQSTGFFRDWAAFFINMKWPLACFCASVALARMVENWACSWFWRE